MAASPARRLPRSTHRPPTWPSSPSVSTTTTTTTTTKTKRRGKQERPGTNLSWRRAFPKSSPVIETTCRKPKLSRGGKKKISNPRTMMRTCRAIPRACIGGVAAETGRRRNRKQRARRRTRTSPPPSSSSAAVRTFSDGSGKRRDPTATTTSSRGGCSDPTTLRSEKSASLA